MFPGFERIEIASRLPTSYNVPWRHSSREEKKLDKFVGKSWIKKGPYFTSMYVLVKVSSTMTLVKGILKNSAYPANPALANAIGSGRSLQ